MTLDDRRTPRLLLVGGGHAHVEVIRRLGARSAGSLDVTLLSPSSKTPYSGMLPGFVSGAYGFDEFHIDLAGLCSRADVTFVQDEATGIDLSSRQLHRSEGPTLGFDILSLDVGSTPSLPRREFPAIPAKPISEFSSRIMALEDTIRSLRAPMRLAVVGSGPAGIELAFALRARTQSLLAAEPSATVRICVVGRSEDILSRRGALARRLVNEALARHGIDVIGSFEASDFVDGALVDGDGRRLPVDEAIWATSSAAPRWLGETGLTLDAKGFVRVDDTLRSISHTNVFAAGDVASLPSPRPKSGVFAVREGPVLAENLIRAAACRKLLRYRPQRHWLVIISTSDGKAVADKWGLAVAGRWVSRWKEWNDRRFVRRYGSSADSNRDAA